MTHVLAYGFTFGTMLMLTVKPFTRFDFAVTVVAAAFACWFWRRCFGR